MSDIMVTIILHHTSESGNDQKTYLKTIQSIFNQTNKSFEVLVLQENIGQDLVNRIDEINTEAASVQYFDAPAGTLGEKLNPAFKKAAGEYILYLSNEMNSIILKRGAIDLFLLADRKGGDAGMVYGDYELEENGVVREIHLLKHHIGRVRDNEDYGKVFFFPRKVLEQVGYADASLKFNTIYDLRLKVSENHKLVHVANRYAGSLYKTVEKDKGHNVFDYLLASKESQLEAEQVLTEHLKRINAYLAPGDFYIPRPDPGKNSSLKASVIIPVNNRPEFIGMAIESVQAQTIREVEVVVVVNGGPDDTTAQEVKRYMPGGDKYDETKPQVQLLVFDINNLGLCLNMGAMVARGMYYVQLDSDDRLKSDAVEKILKVYEDDPKIGMVIGSYEVWEKSADGKLRRMENLPVVTHDEWTKENGRNNLLRINGAGAPRSIPIQLIRDMLFSVNEEPYSRNYGEDYDMVLRISEKHRIGRVWDAIYEVIRHSGGTDHSIDQATIDRNNEAKDHMRKEAILRRIKANKG
jgi:glycosyltransferase involved in cell wall biosynthesis